MRGTGERVFHTASINLMERLVGRTFGSSKARGDYPAKDRAALDVEDLAFALVRWVVDIYHNTPHEGLGGRTPLEQWEADMRDGNYPRRAMPDARTKRLAFGIRFSRTLSKAGVMVMGVRYNTATIGAGFVQGGHRAVDVRWDPENLGAIEIDIDGVWYEAPAVFDRFDGVDVHTWMKARRSLRARSASRKNWDQQTVFKALDDIESMVAHKSAAFGLLDRTMSKEDLERFERELFSSFEVASGTKLRPADDGYGQEIEPREPDPVAPQQLAAKNRAKVSGKSAQSKKITAAPSNVEPANLDAPSAEPTKIPAAQDHTHPKFSIPEQKEQKNGNHRRNPRQDSASSLDPCADRAR